MDSELKSLLRIPTGPHIFLHGPEACGKTTLIKSILNDCAVHYYDRHDYVNGEIDFPENGTLALDDAEWWLTGDKLQLLAKKHRLVLISRWPAHRFVIPAMIVLTMKALSPAEMASLIKRHLTSSQAILPSFVDHAVALGKGMTLRMMTGFMRQFWPIYAEPAISGNLPWDHPQLSLRANPRLKPLLEPEQSALAISHAMVNSLSILDRWLLLASYIASHTHARHDLIIFAETGKQKKRRVMPKKTVDNAQVHAPRIFVLDRLLAIFYRICPLDRHPLSVNHASLALTRLIDQNLIMRISQEHNLEQPKLRCNLTPEVSQLLARSQSFSLELYL